MPIVTAWVLRGRAAFEDLLSAVPGQQVLLASRRRRNATTVGLAGIEHSAQATPDAAAGLFDTRRCSYGPRPTPISRPERCWR